MACFHPLTAYLTTYQDGSRKVLFHPPLDYSATFEKISLPCGRCLGCKSDRAKEWSVRIMNELQTSGPSCFVTLTYSPRCLPQNGDLCKPDLQKFFKRLRRLYPDSNIRYFACGEYGSMGLRPHYHAIIFNYWPSDVHFYNKSKSGDPVYWSRELQRLWPFGISVFGSVTFQSARYVASYTYKKAGSFSFGSHPAQFVLMSRRPGIGESWRSSHLANVASDSVPIGLGEFAKSPRFYLVKTFGPDDRLSGDLSSIKAVRRLRAGVSGFSDPSTLASRELVFKRLLNLYRR